MNKEITVEELKKVNALGYLNTKGKDHLISMLNKEE